MFKQPSEQAIALLRESFPVGSRVQLVQIEDAHTTLKPGDLGTVVVVHDTGTVFCNWDNGSTLGALFGVDKIRRVEEGR